MRRAAVLGFVLLMAVGSYVLFRDRATRKPASADTRRLAPDFTLNQLSGEPLTLSNYRGKVVLLDFWATWCEPCRKETPFFIELQNQYRDQGLQIIGVSMDDTPDPARDFYREFKINYPVVMGNAKIGELYGGVLGLPIAFLIARDGVVYAKHMGATDAAVFQADVSKLVNER